MASDSLEQAVYALGDTQLPYVTDFLRIFFEFPYFSYRSVSMDAVVKVVWVPQSLPLALRTYLPVVLNVSGQTVASTPKRTFGCSLFALEEPPLMREVCSLQTDYRLVPNPLHLLVVLKLACA